MFIETNEGIVNTALVVTVETKSRGADAHGNIKFTDGTTRRTSSPEAFHSACGVIVPAPAGFDVVTATLPAANEQGVVYVTDAVIAFRIAGGNTGYDGPIPITISGEPEAYQHVIWTVRQPSGACFGSEGDHVDIDAFKAACQSAARARRAA